jgi:hypothetical protein
MTGTLWVVMCRAVQNLGGTVCRAIEEIRFPVPQEEKGPPFCSRREKSFCLASVSGTFSPTERVKGGRYPAVGRFRKGLNTVADVADTSTVKKNALSTLQGLSDGSPQRPEERILISEVRLTMLSVEVPTLVEHSSRNRHRMAGKGEVSVSRSTSRALTRN